MAFRAFGWQSGAIGLCPFAVSIKHCIRIRMKFAVAVHNHPVRKLRVEIDLLQGDLLDDMNKRETFYPPETIVRFVIQILDALRYLHKKVREEEGRRG